jgi:uncharacterized protein YjdB
MADEALYRDVGEIKGMLSQVLSNQAAYAATHAEQITKIDERLRKVEINGVVSSGVTSSIVAVGITLLSESLKNRFL